MVGLKAGSLATRMSNSQPFVSMAVGRKNLKRDQRKIDDRLRALGSKTEQQTVERALRATHQKVRRTGTIDDVFGQTSPAQESARTRLSSPAED